MNGANKWYISYLSVDPNV